MAKKYIFICGCPRSGTSALCNLMNTHPDVCIGMERYYKKIIIDTELSPYMFDLPRFLDYHTDDSFWTDLPQKGMLSSKYENATYIGEKLPRLYERFDLLKRNFSPDSVRIIFIFREIMGVAESYTRRARNPDDNLWGRDQDWRVAVQDWNKSIFTYFAYKDDLQILPVSYEKIYCSHNDISEQAVQRIADFLQIRRWTDSEIEGLRPKFFGRIENIGKGGILSAEECSKIMLKADGSKWEKLAHNFM